MKKWIIALASIGAVIAAVTYLASRYVSKQSELGENVVVGTLRSDVLGEGREFLVHLPESYAREPTRRFPVIYVLDGRRRISTRPSRRRCSRGTLPYQR